MTGEPSPPKGTDTTAEPRHNSVLNPYPDIRVWKCPLCDAKTGQKKLPLAIYIEPCQLVALNYTCRYCRACDLLIAQKHDIESLLAATMLQVDPELIGNEYLIFGTMERVVWKQNAKQPLPPAQAIESVQRFKTYYQEMRVTETGWFPTGVTPPIRQLPASEAWVKRQRGKHHD